MNVWKNNKVEKKFSFENNRINFLIAVIFLLGGLIIYRLFELQIKEHDLYVAMASNQHQIFNKLKPDRGNIFMSDYQTGSRLYPLATNKEFALVYVIPKDIKNYDEISEKLYIVFDQEIINKEVDKLLKKIDNEKLEKELKYIENLNLNNDGKNEKIIEIKANHNTMLLSLEHKEFIDIKRELEINLRKEKVINEYLKKLKKKNDPYEPIKKKVDEETLKKLYSVILSSEKNIINVDDLIFKNRKIWLKHQNDELEELILNGISYKMILHRYYPEDNVGSHVVGFTSLLDDVNKGNYGLEGFFDIELSGEYGLIKSERSANKAAIILNDREYSSPVNGSDFVLTIDRSIQFMACKKLNEVALRQGADGGTVIVMEPSTGAIIAMCSYPDYDPNFYKDVKDIKIYNNPAIFEQYEPGSVFKTITMAIALDQEKVTPDTKYFDEGQIMIEGWHKPIKNSDYDIKGGHGEVNMNIVLEESLNTGAIFAMRQVEKKIFVDYIKKFGFGEKIGIELQTENLGNINNLLKSKIQEIYLATASYGQGISTTPLQMVSSYNAIANKGILMKPYLVKEIIHNGGAREKIYPKQIRRVISERASVLVSGMLVNVVEGGHAIKAKVDGYYIGGKTGTAEVASRVRRGYSNKTIHTFIGYGPIDDPKFVMLVKLDDPKDVQYSASSAAPLFGEISKFMLNYWQIEKERD
ncbi:MAG: peptidoglycan D,D-transpeptidase FtsI family protein [Methanosarcinaceae archaeon]